MNNLMIFENSEFGKVRSVIVDGKPYFVGKDVAEVLGYNDPSRAVRQHCRGRVKHPILDNTGFEQLTSIITEGDLYRLIIKSKLPSAERFEAWVMDEVLPSIRQTGGYSLERSIPKTYGEALLEAGRLAIENEQKQLVIESQEVEIKELKEVNTYLENENERLQAVCNIPKSQLIKDIKCFVSDYVKQKDTLGSKVGRDSMYEAYRFARRARMEQPCKYTFEDIVSTHCKLHRDREGNWLDVKLNEAKLKRM